MAANLRDASGSAGARSESELGTLKTADNLWSIAATTQARTTEARRSLPRNAFEQPPDASLNAILGIEHGGACHEDIGAGLYD